MYEFMLGQGVPEGQANGLRKGMPTYWGEIIYSSKRPAYIGL
jgi:hypothetical protein